MSPVMEGEEKVEAPPDCASGRPGWRRRQRFAQEHPLYALSTGMPQDEGSDRSKLRGRHLAREAARHVPGTCRPER